jgi:hypothetical protein
MIEIFSIIASLKKKLKGDFMNYTTSQLKSKLRIKNFIKNNIIKADIVYENKNKIVISLKHTKNINVLKLENKIIGNYSTLYDRRSHNGKLKFEIDNSEKVKGILNEYFLFFNFEENICKVKYDIFLRSILVKEVPYVLESLDLLFYSDIKSKSEKTLNIEKINQSREDIEKDYPEFYKSDYFNIDNKEIVDFINNSKYNLDKVKRSKKLLYLMRVSTDTSAVYDTFKYLSKKFNLSNSNKMWLIYARRYWDDTIKYLDLKEKNKYFNEVKKYFLEDDEYEKYFKGLEIEKIKQKIEIF